MMCISSDDRRAMLSLVRSAVEASVCRRPLPSADRTGLLGESRGCFVTLTNAGHLRGCIGTFQPQASLAETLVEMAAAASHDSRFVTDPITPAELPELSIEISILSPLEKTDRPEELDVGRHGIYIVRGYRSGCFLPEVATDQGWNVREFLDYCCTHKAGLPPNAWADPATEVYLFTSEKFGE